MYPLLGAMPDWAVKEEQHYAAGKLILEPFVENDFLYILLNGSAIVYNYGMDGGILNIYDYEAIDYFGEVELLSGQRYPLMVQAKTACDVLRIRGEDFIRWLGEDSDFSLYIMRRLSKKLLASTNQVLRFSMMDMRQRYLLTIYGYYKSGMLDKATKAQVAETIYAPMRSLNRIIAQNNNLISFSSGRFLIQNEGELEAVCEDIQQQLWCAGGQTKL